MRFLYDIYSTRRRADVVLLGADFLSVCSVVLFATGACHREDWQSDLAFIVLWSVIPRGAASFLRWFEWPREFLSGLVVSTLLLLSVAVLMLCGWELIWAASPPELRPGAPTMVVILLAWASGFLLGVPRAYRLSDFLLGATILLAVLERMPQALLWIPLFLFGTYLSATTRHLLYDVFPNLRQPPINLQNVRALSTSAAVLGASMFSVLFLGLYEFLDESIPEPSPATAGSNWSYSVRRWKGSRDDSRLGGAGPGGVTNGERGGRRSVERSGGSGPGNPVRRQGARERRVGFSQSVGLSDLARPRYDHRLVLAAQLVDEEGEELKTLPPPSWKPETFLWRGLALSYFDPGPSSWAHETTFERREWPPSGTVRMPGPSFSETLRLQTLRLQVVVVTPVFRNLVTPYFATELGPVEPNVEGSFYRQNRFGEIFPKAPGIRRGFRYHLRLYPQLANSNLPRGAGHGKHADPGYLQVPSSDEVGVDLVRLSREIGLDRGLHRDRLARLEAFYRRGFLYSDKAFWQAGGHPLGAFLLKEKLGDCGYFATSAALLLRAGGLSTRLVVGFLGSEPPADEPHRTYVRNLQAHSWIEVYFGEAGWYPIDATACADAHPDYVRPTESVTASPESTPPPEDETDDSGQFGDARRKATSDRTPWNDLPRYEADRVDGDGDGDGNGDGDGLVGEHTPDGRLDVFSLGLSREPDTNDDDSWMTASLVYGDDKETEKGNGEQSSPSTARVGDSEAWWNDSVAEPMLNRKARTFLLRSSLVTLALVAGALVLLTFLRPKRKKKDDSDEETEEEEDQPFGLTEFEPTQLEPVTLREELLYEYDQLQAELAKTRSHRLAHQTPLEHGRRFRGQDDDLDRSFRKLHKAIYTALYGEREPEKAEILEAQQHCRRIRKSLG